METGAWLGPKITSDSGLRVYRELDEVFGLTAVPEEMLDETCSSSGVD